MNDRELLERAAKAAGLKYTAYAEPQELDPKGWGFVAYLGMGYVSFWNPLTDDGDALRLAVKLKMEILFFDGFEEIHANSNGLEGEAIEGYQGDMAAATRRAITRCAAFIGGKK